MQQILLLFNLLIYVLASPVLTEKKLESVTLDDTFGDLNIKMPDKLDDLTNFISGSENVIDNDLLKNFEHDFKQLLKNNLTQNVFSRVSIQEVIIRDDINTKLKDQFIFNIDVGVANSPYNNQKTSGRCWIFAGCNVLRNEVIRKYNLTDDFQISQSYVSFYAHLERANFILQKMVELIDEPFELISRLLRAPYEEGGFWHEFAFLVLKYGLVPHDVFPDTYQAQDMLMLGIVLKAKLQEFGLKIRQLGQKDPNKVSEYKEECLQVIYNILALTLGSPPKPDEKLTWEFADKDGNISSFNITPVDFYKNHIDYNVQEFFSIMNNPKYEYNKLYVTVESEMVNGSLGLSVNAEIKELKNIAINMLKDGKAVYFGANVDNHLHKANGVFDTNVFDFCSAFDFELNLTKKELLLLGIGGNHAMVIAGVHIDPNTNKPVRWKVQNSWGEDIGHEGWFLMTDDWFDKNVHDIISSKDYVSGEIYAAWTSGEYYPA